jgi:hypothetical protein
MIAARSSNVGSRPPSRARHVAGRSAATQRNARKSWAAKLRADMQPEVVADRRSGGSLLLPTPMLIAEALAAVPRGSVITMSRLRDDLAHRFDAERTCPLMTGIFATIVAGVVAEDLGQHRSARWPIWRLVRDDGTLPPKWPLDPLYRATQLRAEGVRLTRRRGCWAALDI